MYSSKTEIGDQDDFYLKNFQSKLDTLNDGSSLILAFIRLVFKRGIPIIITPTIGSCFGMQPYNPFLNFEDGYIRWAYDIFVTRADPECLFNKYVNVPTPKE